MFGFQRRSLKGSNEFRNKNEEVRIKVICQGQSPTVEEECDVVTCCVWLCCCTAAVVDISAAGSREGVRCPHRVMALTLRRDPVGSPRGVMLLLRLVQPVTSRILLGSAAPGLEVPASSHWVATAEGKA